MRSPQSRPESRTCANTRLSIFAEGGYGTVGPAKPENQCPARGSEIQTSVPWGCSRAFGPRAGLKKLYWDSFNRLTENAPGFQGQLNVTTFRSRSNRNVMAIGIVSEPVART